jgi:phosphatidate cytidylyltransferase
LLTLFTVKATFLGLVAIAVGVALLELSRALSAREINLPLVPVAAGGAAMLGLAYWAGERAALAAFAGTMVLLLAWRLSRLGWRCLYVPTSRLGLRPCLPSAARRFRPAHAGQAGRLPADAHLRRARVCSDVGGISPGYCSAST